ncbi:MAG: hypothetical protein R2795_14475 [Saprospiraceae bacterium]
MIEAFVIDEITEELSASEKAFEHTLEWMNKEQPILLAFLFSDNFEVFTEREREFLLFLTTVIWKSVFKVYGAQEPIDEDMLADAEEHNWELLQSTQAHHLRDRLTVFFEEHPEEEELLAFVEDAILDDEESPVTAEGREPLFVSLKSIIDCLVLPHLS